MDDAVDRSAILDQRNIDRELTGPADKRLLAIERIH